MSRKCIRYRNTEAGRRCAKFADAGGDVSHNMVDVSFKGYGVFDRNVNSTDVLVGAAAGMVGSLGFKYLVGKYAQDMMPAALQNFMPAIGAVAAGSAAYAMQRKGNKARAEGHLVGAMAAAAAVQTWSFLKAQFPELADVVSLKLGNYGGLIVDEPGRAMGGLFVNEQTPAIGPGGAAMGGYADNPGMAQLAGLSMGDDMSGVEELMEMDE
jgi:hypothetical protein